MTHFLSAICETRSQGKCCEGDALLFGVIDFRKNCEMRRRTVLDLSGVPVYYHHCPAWQFLFTDDGGRLTIDLPAARPIPRSVEPPATLKPSGRVLTDAEICGLEADNIRAVFRRAGGKASGPGGAAELLGLKATTLASRIKALGIDPSAE